MEWILQIALQFTELYTCISHSLLCCVAARYWWVLTTAYRITSLALDKFCDYPSASEANMKNMANTSYKFPRWYYNHNETKHGNIMYRAHWLDCIYFHATYPAHYQHMMTSSNVTGHLCGELTGHQVEQTITRLLIWNAIAPIITSP